MKLKIFNHSVLIYGVCHLFQYIMPISFWSLKSLCAGYRGQGSKQKLK